MKRDQWRMFNELKFSGVDCFGIEQVDRYDRMHRNFRDYWNAWNCFYRRKRYN